MTITPLKYLPMILMISGLLFLIGGLFLTLIGKGDIQGFKYFGVVFSVMGIGFHIINKNITEIARELSAIKKKASESNSQDS
jgi:hypothetical protein